MNSEHAPTATPLEPLVGREWSVTAPAWTPSDGFTESGNPRLTILQRVCALGYCVSNEADEDALNHCSEIIKELWFRRGKVSG